MRRLASLFVSIVVLVAAARPARAQDIAREAERLTQEGMSLARANRLEDAILRFRASERLVPRGANDCNIGLAFSMMERHAQALLYLDSCTHREGKDVRPWVPELRTKTRRVLERGKYAEVNLVTEPVAARVTVAAWGPESSFTAPRLFWLPVGEHTLKIQAPGHVDGEKKIDVATTAPLRVQVELTRTPTPEPPQPTPVVTTPTPTATPIPTPRASVVPVAVAPSAPTLSPRKRALRIAGYSLLGLGVAGGAAIFGSGYALAFDAVDTNDPKQHRLGSALVTAGWTTGGILVGTGAILTLVGHLK